MIDAITLGGDVKKRTWWERWSTNIKICCEEVLAMGTISDKVKLGWHRMVIPFRQREDLLFWWNVNGIFW